MSQAMVFTTYHHYPDPRQHSQGQFKCMHMKKRDDGVREGGGTYNNRVAMLFKNKKQKTIQD